jgi:hypothetical protein
MTITGCASPGPLASRSLRSKRRSNRLRVARVGLLDALGDERRRAETRRPLRRDRLGRTRIIDREAPRGVIEIVAIGPRSTIYEATVRLVKKESR